MRYLKRLLLFVLLIAHAVCGQVVPGQGPSLTCKYGGLLNVVVPGGGTGHWTKHKWPSGRWTLIDPHGHPVFGLSMEDSFLNNFQAGVLDTKYGNHNVTWGPQINRRIKAWGFNLLSGSNDCSTSPSNTSACGGGANWPDSGFQPISMPFIFYQDSFGSAIRNVNNYCAAGTNAKDLFGGVNQANFASAYLGGINVDPYDPCYSTWINAMLVDTNDNGNNVPVIMASPWTIAIELGESDRYYGFQTGPTTEGFTTTPPGQLAFNVAAGVLAASPWESYYSHFSTAHVFTVNREYYAKQVGLQNFLTGRYASIAALNTAWGSTYDTFGTDGTNRTQSLGTGDGSTLTFSATLTFTPDHGSIWVKVGAAVVAGIDDCCPPSTTNNLAGPTVGSGTVNFSTKALTITFSGGNAPGNGVAVTADYYSGGWGNGNGVMDEDGRHSWMPQTAAAWGTLAGLTATMQTDLNDFFQAYADKHFKIPHDAIKANYPNVMYWGGNGLAGYCNPPPRPVLKGAAPYLDVLANALTTCNQAQDQSVLNDYATYLGDIPLVNFWFLTANADSGQSAGGTYCCFSSSSTQNARGTIYQTVVDIAFSQAVTIAGPQNGTIPTLMTVVWAWEDDPSQKNNYGLVSVLDNAYDGRESTIAVGIDSWGYPTGGEVTSYGTTQPSYVPQVEAENFKIQHQLEAALFAPGPYSTNLALDKPTVCSSEVIPPPSGSIPAPWIKQACGRASDGDTATTWQPSGSDPQFMRIDMVGQPSMGKVILRWGAGFYSAYTIDTSNDGITWTNQFTKAGGSGGVETDTFTAVSARYIRMNGTTRSGTPTLQEFEVYAQ